MSTADYDYESDSSFSGSDEEESGIYLGLPDGALENQDESNPLVSRIGGRPAWLPFRNHKRRRLLPPTPVQVSQCKICNRPMELLVQIFAPLEASSFDRTLSVWGCARLKCQRARNSESVRVFRSVTFNARWAAKLEKQKAKEMARLAKAEAEKEQAAELAVELAKKATINPFSTTNGLAANPFGSNPFSSANPFSGDSSEVAVTTPKTTSHDNATVESNADDPDSEAEEEQFRVAEEEAIKATLAEQSAKDSSAFDAWKSSGAAPYYKNPQYVSTVPEPVSSTDKKSKNATNGNDDNIDGAEMLAPDGKPYAKENYEKMFLSSMDPIFERFVDRVGRSSSQLIRYEFGGEPLPFSNKGKVFGTFWKKSKTNTAAAQKSPPMIEYDAQAAGKCSFCGARRVFEMQLMPNVVNVLRPQLIQDDGDDEQVSSKQSESKLKQGGAASANRKREIEMALGGRIVADPQVAADLAATGIHRSTDHDTTETAVTPDDELIKTGLTWSTVLVFVCEKDCVAAGAEADEAVEEACVEERAEIMWEDM